jgi:hypothetical protein
MRALLPLVLAVPLMAANPLTRLGTLMRPAPGLRPSASKAPTRGEGIVSGHVDFSCPARGRARLTGTAHLSGPVKLTAAGGYAGTVMVSAFEPLSGLCSGGEGTVMQTLTLRGEGALTGPGGLSRRVAVTGRLPLTSHGPAPRLWVGATLSVSGR